MEEFDLDKLEQEFNESWKEEEETEEVTEDTEETEESEESETEDIETEDTEETEEIEETDEEEEEEESETLDKDEPFTKKPKQTKEENAAFAEMRKQKEALEQQNKTLEMVAAQYGMTVPQFQEAFQKQEEEARAKNQGIPVDVLRRMESMERQLNDQKTSSHKDKFWNEVDTVKAKYNLNDAEVTKIFDYIGQNGLVNIDTGTPAVPFEFLYKAANFDNAIERKTNEAKQQALAAKKKRQTKSAPGHTSNSNAGDQVKDDYTVDEVEKMLKNEGLL